MPMLIRRHMPPRTSRVRRAVSTYAHAAPATSHLSIAGMAGIGDNLHQRAILRQLLPRYGLITLETPWPCLYHDLVGPKLRLAPKVTGLRTQTKNIAREGAAFTAGMLPRGTTNMRIWYTGEDVRRHGSILAAMLANARCQLTDADFRLPVKPEWRQAADEILEKHGYRGDRPLMVYRPLVERTEWMASNRNPDPQAYQRILQEMRGDYFVVSVADLVPESEWITSVPVHADVEFHQGELTLDVLAGLFTRANLVYSAPGFAPVLAQAVGAPVVCVFGGRENSMAIQHGMKFSPTCTIDTVAPCSCFDHAHACNKEIDIIPAITKTTAFRAQFA